MENEDVLMDILLARIERLEYHQKLLLNMISPTGNEFNQLIIKKQLDENEVDAFFSLCEELNNEMEKQKADKFVFYAPLFIEFLYRLNPKLEAAEVIDACLLQNVYVELMTVLQKNIQRK
jgi:hypothetical protein